jgi:hypothetical protein
MTDETHRKGAEARLREVDDQAEAARGDPYVVTSVQQEVNEAEVYRTALRAALERAEKAEAERDLEKHDADHYAKMWGASQARIGALEDALGRLKRGSCAHHGG